MRAANGQAGWPGRRLAAWSVHALTASGAVWALLALNAVAAGRYRTALGWMTVAVVVDGVDGALARAVGVRSALPSIDGTLLDNLIDYVTYVVVPAYLMHHAGLFPDSLGLAGGATICLVSALQFAHVQAKTVDRYFRGFPSYWNVVAFYLLLLRPPSWLVTVVIASLCILVFVPVYFVYPTRTRELRALTLVFTAMWGVWVLVLLWQFPDPSPWLVYASLAYAVYYVVLSCRFTLRRLRHRT